MKRILVPCDFSDSAKQAFKFAVAVASAVKGEIYLLHVIELPTLHGSLMVPVQAYEKSFISQLRRKYDTNVAKLKEQFAGKVSVHSSVETGSVESGIEKFTKRKKIDLIVMGTHGVKGVRDFVLGSNTEKTIRNATVPVIAIKKASQLSGIKDIILPVDLKGLDKKVISFLTELQKMLKARLHIVYVNCPEKFTRSKEAEQALSALAKTGRLKNYSLNIYNDMSEESGIRNFSDRFKNKLVVMPTRGRKGINHLFNGSVTEDVIGATDSPVLTLHK